MPEFDTLRGIYHDIAVAVAANDAHGVSAAGWRLVRHRREQARHHVTSCLALGLHPTCPACEEFLVQYGSRAGCPGCGWSACEEPVPVDPLDTTWGDWARHLSEQDRHQLKLWVAADPATTPVWAAMRREQLLEHTSLVAELYAQLCLREAEARIERVHGLLQTLKERQTPEMPFSLEDVPDPERVRVGALLFFLLGASTTVKE